MNENDVARFERAVDELRKTLRSQAELLQYRIDIEGMLAANQEREAKGEALAYNEAAFQEIRGLIEGIDWWGRF